MTPDTVPGEAFGGHKRTVRPPVIRPVIFGPYRVRSRTPAPTCDEPRTTQSPRSSGSREDRTEFSLRICRESRRGPGYSSRQGTEVTTTTHPPVIVTHTGRQTWWTPTREPGLLIGV